MLIYASILSGLCVGQHFSSEYYWWDLSNFLYFAFERGLIVLVALIAMARMRIRSRIVYLLALQSIRLLIALFQILLDPLGVDSWTRFPSTYCQILAQDALEWGFVALVAHSVASLLGVYVSALAPNEAGPEQKANSHIAEWGYVVLLIGLLFTPQPWAPMRTWMQPDWAPITLDYIPLLLFHANSHFTLPFTGLLVLCSLRNWKLATTMLACIVSIKIGANFYFQDWDDPRGPVVAFFLSILAAMNSAPYWLLVRCAGYRLVSSRKWIAETVASEHKPTTAHSP